MEASLVTEGSPNMCQGPLVEDASQSDFPKPPKHLKRHYRRTPKPKAEPFRYSASTMKEDVLRMETGLPDRVIFDIIVGYTGKFKESINYYFGWQVKCLSFEDQILMTLMKLRQNYTHLHLATLFRCSPTSVSNVILTFTYVLHKLWFNHMNPSIRFMGKAVAENSSSTSLQRVAMRRVVSLSSGYFLQKLSPQ